jgi:hypothetical protein
MLGAVSGICKVMSSVSWVKRVGGWHRGYSL